MRVCIKTYGCTLNQADSNIMKSILESNGVMITERIDDADVAVVNTCTVKNITAQKILYRLSRMHDAGRKIVVTGCMASANRNLIEKYAPSASVVDTSNIGRIAEVAERLDVGKRMVVEDYAKVDKMALFNADDGIIAKIPINEGCTSNCSFCETKFARGPLNSFSEEKILDAVAQSARMGAKEIQLTSQDVGAYGIDSGTDIATLMGRIAQLDGDFKVRVGMINPEHLHRCFDGFAKELKGEKFYKFAHIPVQSGSNKVLKDMGRKGTIEEFEGYVKELRRKVPGVTIETDLIAGFPTESDDQFKETIDFVRRTRPEVTNISRFGARPHACASKMRQQSTEMINRRSVVLSRAVRQVQHEINDKFIGKRFDVIVTESNEKSLNGRNGSYRQVVIGRNDAKGIMVGERVDALVNAASANVFYATVQKVV